jgi:hypothetical protein
MKRWILQVLLAVDQLLNALCGGWADETLSSRAWRLESRSAGWRRTRKAIDAVFAAFGDRQHCFESYTSERLRLHFPPELREGEPS